MNPAGRGDSKCCTWSLGTGWEGWEQLLLTAKLLISWGPASRTTEIDRSGRITQTSESTYEPDLNLAMLCRGFHWGDVGSVHLTPPLRIPIPS